MHSPASQSAQCIRPAPRFNHGIAFFTQTPAVCACAGVGGGGVKYRPFEEVPVWKAGVDLTVKVFGITQDRTGRNNPETLILSVSGPGHSWLIGKSRRKNGLNR
jgi:hypothetical protein